MNNKNAACTMYERSSFPEETSVAMAYIPFQQWQEPYDVLKGYDKGTIFECLDKPFYGRKGEPR